MHTVAVIPMTGAIAINTPITPMLNISPGIKLRMSTPCIDGINRVPQLSQ